MVFDDWKVRQCLLAPQAYNIASCCLHRHSRNLPVPERVLVERLRPFSKVLRCRLAEHSHVLRHKSCTPLRMSGTGESRPHLNSACTASPARSLTRALGRDERGPLCTTRCSAKTRTLLGRSPRTPSHRTVGLTAAGPARRCRSRAPSIERRPHGLHPWLEDAAFVVEHGVHPSR